MGLPLMVRCPNGCIEYGRGLRYNYHHTLRPMFKKNTADILVIKCPQCKFEAWASEDLQKELGKPNQPYYNGTEIVQPSGEKLT